MKKFYSTAILCTLVTLLHAKEGMWIPSLLGAVYDDMQAYGLKLTQEDLYSVNHSSVKDAIVLFGGGCTAEIVSNEGLLFTNHHCGFDYVQFHTTLQHDYLKDGFWAMNHTEELVCNGLSVVFIVRMDDVTDRMRKGIAPGMAQKDVDAILTANRKLIEEEYKTNNPGLGLQLKAFNYGNQYFAMVTKTYNDVRLVGAPPSAVGKFGGDTDNWVWPRHTGDFSVFRIYANKDNEPAGYSKDNVPFKPAHFLPISMDGAHEGDFSMVYGFPGRTDHLLTSYAVDYVMNKSNPMRIGMRDKTIAIMAERMRSSDALRIKYAAKQSDVANAWKKWKGQQIGLTNFRALDQKKKFEADFSAGTKTKDFASYGKVLQKLDSLYKLMEPHAIAREAFVEYVYYGPELFNFAYKFNDLVNNYDTLQAKGKLQSTIDVLKADARLFYKDFDLDTEIAIYEALTPLYRSAQTIRNMSGINDKPELLPVFDDSDLNMIVAGKSIFQDSTLLIAMLNSFGKKSVKKIRNDYFYSNAVDMFNNYNKVTVPRYRELQSQIDYYMQQYTEATALMFPGDSWADANSTLRISFGKVEGSEPRDGEVYKYYTTSDGILEKYYTQNPDFELNPRLIELFQKKSYGAYADNGELRICYTGSNHTTGGNSGSPALNGKGELTGINFDRSWESTMSDITYNPEICRNIMVDVRYVLWVIDVYAGAGYLLNEMTLVRK